MGKDSIDVQKYWDEKEKFYGEKLIVKSVALYDGGHPDYTETESGLLFLMSGGLCFESFEKQHIFSLKRKNFTKIFLRIPLSVVSDYRYNANVYPSLKEPVTIFKKPVQSKLELIFIHNEVSSTAIFRNITPHDHWEEALKNLLTKKMGRDYDG